MKKKKVILIIIVVIALIVMLMMMIPMFFNARGASPDLYPEETTDEAIELSLDYICPMDCEDGKKYQNSGNCPICQMPLSVFQNKNVLDNSRMEDNTTTKTEQNSSNSVEQK